MGTWITWSAPPYDGEYIVTCKGAKRAMNLTYEDGKWINSDGTEFEVSAWMPFPPAYVPSQQTEYGA
jgi:hypothetical protein